ncbi:tetratricopeptide repeat protein [Sphingomonas arenae]|uniref:tetratricopeptide repeat protein n=1 Tax=Sphingomonas arenae TaxID=2812555 RepID=UPI001968544B|nr:tetratricopeptide repeat protein [Sphingomonas arenae]
MGGLISEVADEVARERDTLRYSAFISYNHKDRAWAAWLHGKLERYRLPDTVVGRAVAWGVLETRLAPVFQDREELAASTDLASSVRQALKEAANLIVICSTNGAQSRWVNEEVREFVALGRRSQIQCLIVPEAEHPAAPLLPEAQLFPPALLELGIEPLAADARPSGDGRQAAFLKLVAGLIGVRYDELRQREQARRQKRLVLLASAALAGFLLMSALAAFAFISRAEAVRERDLARQKTITAQRTTDFVKNLFRLADPSEAKGNSITVREVLDRGARQIEGELSGEPDTKAELVSTLSEVYMGLGAYRQADGLIRRSLSLPVRSGETRARQLAALGASLALQGNYQEAIATYRRAAVYMPDGEKVRDPVLLSQIQIGQAESLAALEQYGQAWPLIRQAFGRDLAREGPTGQSVARALEAGGFTAQMEGDFSRSRALYTRALAIRRQQGNLHPKVSENLGELGTIAYLAGDAASAEQYWRQALARDQQVLGPDHPDSAATLNNLGRVLLEQRKLPGALQLLNRSANIYLAQRNEEHDDLAFIFANVGLARAALGDRSSGERYLRRALDIAELHEHPALAPIMTDLADLRCKAGGYAEGLALLERAAPIMAETYPHDPWRSAWVVNTRGACLVARGDVSAGSRLLQASAPAVLKRWPDATLYGSEVKQRLAASRRAQRR